MSEPERPTCGTCPYWNDAHAKADWREIGACIRNAPSPNVGVFHEMRDEPDYVMWPMTGSEESCGEHPSFPAYIASLQNVTAHDRDGSTTSHVARSTENGTV